MKRPHLTAFTDSVSRLLFILFAILYYTIGKTDKPDKFKIYVKIFRVFCGHYCSFLSFRRWMRYAGASAGDIPCCAVARLLRSPYIGDSSHLRGAERGNSIFQNECIRWHGASLCRGWACCFCGKVLRDLWQWWEARLICLIHFVIYITFFYIMWYNAPSELPYTKRRKSSIIKIWNQYK